jgi:hypothetical protein
MVLSRMRCLDWNAKLAAARRLEKPPDADPVMKFADGTGD